MKGVAFLAAALVIFQLKRTDLKAYDGLAKRMPLTAFTLAVAFLGLAGSRLSAGSGASCYWCSPWRTAPSAGWPSRPS